MAVQYNPSIVTDGLIMYLDAANSRSYGGTGTTWADLSSQANSITLYNGPAYNTTTTPNISFDGTNDYAVDNGNTAVKNLMTSYSFSISWWAKCNSSSSNQDFVWNTDTDLFSNGFFIKFSPNSSNGIIIFGVNSDFDNNNFLRYSLGGTFVGTWNNWVITNSSSKGLIYRNGSLVSTGSNFLIDIGLLSTSNLPLTIGQLYSTAPNMNLAVFKIYNKTLSASEVSSNYNALRGRFGL